jgi:hypothetical protein
MPAPTTTARPIPSLIASPTAIPGGTSGIPTPTTGPQTTTQSAPRPPVTRTTSRPVPQPPRTTARPPQTTTAPPPPAPKPPVIPPIVPDVPLPNLSPLCNGLNVLPIVGSACNTVLGTFASDVSRVGGKGLRLSNPTSCHPLGLALDLFPRSKARGDEIVVWVRANKDKLGVTTILWQVRDHYDHIHLSFKPCYH